MAQNLAERTQVLVSFGYYSHDFFGVQEQPHLKTVLGTIRNRANKVFGQEPKGLVATTRTDRRVGALANFVTFYVRNLPNAESFFPELEKDHKDGLIGLRAKTTSVHTNARGSSKGKTYFYTVRDNLNPSIITDNSMAWEIAPTLDVAAMKQGASYLVGFHDFASFQGSGCSAFSTLKNLYAIDIYRNNASYVFLTVKGSSFLRRMVRNIVGLLVEIGAGLKHPYYAKYMREQRDRRLIELTAPSWGLMLKNIQFEEKGEYSA